MPSANVAKYFEDKLGRPSKDASLSELPVDSNCGDDCVKTIDAAATLLAMCKMGGIIEDYQVEAIIEATDNNCQVFWRG